MTLLIVLLLLFGLFIFLNNRINNLKQEKGNYYSQWWRINASGSLISYKPFLKLIGINRNLSEIAFDKWMKQEKDIWGKYPEKFTKRMNLKINYLASEDSYFIQPESGNSYLVQRGKMNSLIYSAIIAGDENGLDPHIEFQIFERNIALNGERIEPVFTLCLQYNDKLFNYDKKDFKILCDFPLFDIKKDDELKNLGFEVDRQGADDVYKDSFGEMHSIPLMLKYKKNGAKISQVI
jgi:hypothetical protein